MNDITTNGTALSIYRFGKLNVVENGLVLIKKNKEQTDISFSELNKIYIKKCKIGLINKIGMLSVLLILTAICSVYFPVEIVCLTLILLILLTVKLSTHKKYQLYILLNDGTFFIKNFKKDSKQEYINLVHLVRKEFFHNHIRFNI